jgi:hypothetical protein
MSGDNDTKSVCTGAELFDVVTISNCTREKQFDGREKYFCDHAK